MPAPGKSFKLNKQTRALSATIAMLYCAATVSFATDASAEAESTTIETVEVIGVDGIVLEVAPAPGE